MNAAVTTAQQSTTRRSHHLDKGRTGREGKQKVLAHPALSAVEGRDAWCGETLGASKGTFLRALGGTTE